MRKKISIITLLILSLLVQTSRGKTWTNTSGNSFEGVLLDVEKGMVRIERTSDRKIFEFPVEQLIESDQEEAKRFWDEKMLKLFLEGEKKFLGRYEPKKKMTGWGVMQIGNNPMQGVVRVDGKKVTQYIFAHANSLLEYEIPEGARWFTATGTAADADRASKTWKYIVKVDGKTLFESKQLIEYDYGEVYIKVEFPEQAKRLTLITDSGSKQNADWSIWAKPYFVITK